MSLFGGLMGDIEEDPFMGNQIRRMNSIMSSLMRDPFGEMMGGMGMLVAPPQMGGGRQGVHGGQVALARHPSHHDAFNAHLPIFPVPFPNMGNQLFQQMIHAPPNFHTFSSSTIMTMTQGPDGRPEVYQASTSTRQAPGGIKETKKTVADSRTGLKKMAIGHHIGERAHVIEREQNVYSGEKEERQELINLDEDEAEDFNREWERRSRPSGMRHEAISYGGHPRHQTHREPQLALPSSSPHPHQRETSKSGQKRKSQSEDDTLDQPKSKKATLTEPPQIVLDDDDEDDDNVDDDDDNVVDEEEVSSGEESD